MSKPASEPGPRRARRDLARNLLLAAGATLAAAAMLEGVGRTVERRWPAPRTAAYIWDWRVEWNGDFPSFRPQTIAWPREAINAMGFRDRWRDVERLPHATRVVALGDSVTFGAGIEPEEAYPQRLEAFLRADGRRVEVFNAGMIGWSTRQERLAYERVLRPYRPDQVLLGVCLNDIPEIHNNLARPPAWLRTLHDRSAIARLAVGGHRREIQRVEQLFARPDALLVRKAMASFFDEVRALRSAVERDGARLALVVFPFRFQVLPGAPAPTVQQSIAAFCAQEGLSCLDLRPHLAETGEAAFVDYDHLSPEGAEIVARELISSGLVPRPPSDAEVLGPAAGVASLSRALRSADGRVRAAAAARLGTLGPAAAAAVPTLMERLAIDDDAGVRADAVAALAAIEPEGALVRPLVARLHDRAEAVRRTAADVLAGLPPESIALPDLVAVLETDDAYVRSFAAWSIGRYGPAAGEAAPALLSLLDDESRTGSSGAAAALAILGARDAVPRLAAHLASPDPVRRAEIGAALAVMGARASAAVPALQSALADPDAEVRAQAARALAGIGSAARVALPALLAASEDDDWRVRAEALGAVAELGGDAQGARDAFVAALRDAKPAVRARAALGLSRLGEAARPAVGDIAVLLADRSRDVQVAAARSLAALGPIAEAARPALEKTADHDPRRRVRREAARALENLDAGRGGR